MSGDGTGNTRLRAGYGRFGTGKRLWRTVPGAETVRAAPYQVRIGLETRSAGLKPVLRRCLTVRRPHVPRCLCEGAARKSVKGRGPALRTCRQKVQGSQTVKRLKGQGHRLRNSECEGRLRVGPVGQQNKRDRDWTCGRRGPSTRSRGRKRKNMERAHCLTQMPATALRNLEMAMEQVKGLAGSLAAEAKLMRDCGMREAAAVMRKAAGFAGAAVCQLETAVDSLGRSSRWTRLPRAAMPGAGPQKRSRNSERSVLLDANCWVEADVPGWGCRQAGRGPGGPNPKG
jgi:hypothetical protein